MAVNKVEFDGRVLVDLTDDTVTPEKLIAGTTAHGADGEIVEGVNPYEMTETEAEIAKQAELIEEITAELEAKSAFFLDTTDATAEAGDIREGETAYVNGQKVTGTMKAVEIEFEGNAIEADVLSGKTFYNTSETKKTGTMPNNEAYISKVEIGDRVMIPAGYHNGEGFIYAPTLDGNAVEDDVMSGKTFYNTDGTKKTGAFTIENELTEQDNLIAQIVTALEGKASGGSGGLGEDVAFSFGSSSLPASWNMAWTNSEGPQQIYAPLNITDSIASTLNLTLKASVGSYIFITNLATAQTNAKIETTGGLVFVNSTSSSGSIPAYNGAHIRVDGAGTIKCTT